MTDQDASEAHPFSEAESVIVLSAKAWARLLEMIDSPPPRNQKFLEAQAWYLAVKEQSSK